MFILGIESSCDDTSVALLDCSAKGNFVLSEKIASQIDIHKKYGGVVPEIAGRAHAEKIVPLIEAVLENQPKPHAIAVTSGPGLITGLLVGVEAARALSYSLNIPLVAVNHIEGHTYSVEIKNQKLKIKTIVKQSGKIQFPALCLIVSGGHTELILMKNHGDYKLLGATKDDAAGECFDKVAKLIGLPYPGGPEISKLAQGGKTNAINFPRPMLNKDSFDFSFAGLKTSALYWLQDNKLPPLNPPLKKGGITTTPPPPPLKGGVARGRSGLTIADFCASFEQAIIDVLTAKTINAAKKFNPKTIIVGGGVSANKKLRKTLEVKTKNLPAAPRLLLPASKYCMDNAAMIAAAGYHHAKKKDFISWKKIKANPNWKIA